MIDVHPQRHGGARSPATTRICSRRCARSSACARRRTGARRPVSAGAAPCSSTARRWSAATSRSPRSTGAAITTLEGLAAAERDRMAAAFAATGALQCGFCTPGILVRTASLLEKKGAGLDRDTAARHLGAHLCRCTGYVKILDAVELLAKGESPRARRARRRRHERHPLPGPRPRAGREGLRRRPAASTACSTARCTSPSTPRADVVAHRHERGGRGRRRRRACSPAADVPGELQVGLIHKDWPVFIPVGGRTSYLGDVLAIVVAETRADRARARPRSSRSQYDALAPDHRSGRRRRRPTRTRCGVSTATCCRARRTRAATSTPRSAASAHVVHEVFQTQRIEHAFLEPESTLAVPAARRPSCTCTRAARACGTTATRSRRCSAVDADRSHGRAGVERRRVRRQGGHEQPGADRARGLAARTRPVKCTLSREESLLIHPKRHPIRIEPRGRLRRRRAPHRAAGPHASATRGRTRRSA